MKKMGVRFCLSCPVESVEDSPVGAKVVCRSTNGEVQAFEAEKVLVAVGRGPNTASLGLDTGMIGHSKGNILVNDKMETSLPGVYAVGDCVKGYSQLAHTASAIGIEYTVGKFPMAGNGKALILNGGEGVVKILADKNTRVLGMHIIGPRATDLIAEGALSIEAGLSVDTLIATIHSYPTVTEAMREAALSIQHRAIHIVNR